jgi:hypothetical protein
LAPVLMLPGLRPTAEARYITRRGPEAKNPHGSVPQ